MLRAIILAAIGCSALLLMPRAGYCAESDVLSAYNAAMRAYSTMNTDAARFSDCVNMLQEMKDEADAAIAVEEKAMRPFKRSSWKDTLTAMVRQTTPARRQAIVDLLQNARDRSIELNNFAAKHCSPLEAKVQTDITEFKDAQAAYERAEQAQASTASRDVETAQQQARDQANESALAPFYLGLAAGFRANAAAAAAAVAAARQQIHCRTYTVGQSLMTDCR